MKIDKSRPGHWLALLVFACNVMLALVWRWLSRRSRQAPWRIVLYGHKLNGNLRALHEHLQGESRDRFEVAFLTMDRAYHRRLLAQGVNSVLATGPASIRLLRQADAVISDHGLHSMQPMLGRCDLTFVDVWHGIPFKGFDAADFRVQHRYDEIWVASPLLRELYIERFGFDPGRVEVTGYARTDKLVQAGDDRAGIRRELGLEQPDTGKIVLFAPTWRQDARHRSLFPFGSDENTFMRCLSQLAEEAGATIVMRAHLNSIQTQQREWPRIVQRSHADYPDAEQLLLISDVLVCDWSSIAFDYLLLGRPTLFLDVPAPFAKGFSLGPEYRFGELVAGMQPLAAALKRCLRDPDEYRRRHGQKMAQVREKVYGDYADGHSAERCVRRLSMLLGER